MSIAHLYRPCSAEIQPKTAKAIANAPHLRTRIERAAQIVLDHDLRWRDHWQAGSQSDVRTWYDTDLHGCTCADYIRGQDNLFQGRPACKHRLALLIYRELLLDHLARMTEGVLTSESIRRQNLGAPIILQLGDSNTLSGGRYNGVSLMIRFAYNPIRQRRHFKTEVDMAHFAAWLHQVAQVEPSAVAIQPDPISVNNWPTAANLTTLEKIEAADADLLPYEDWRELYR